MLWRISRGNVFLRQAELERPLEDPATVSPYFPLPQLKRIVYFDLADWKTNFIVHHLLQPLPYEFSHRSANPILFTYISVRFACIILGR